MKLSILSSLIAGFAASGVGAAGISDLPQCAQSGLLSVVGSSSCKVGDVSCVCNDMSVLAALQGAIQKNCSPQDAMKALTAGMALCPNIGMSLTTPASTASNSAQSSPASNSASGTTGGGSAGSTTMAEMTVTSNSATVTMTVPPSSGGSNSTAAKSTSTAVVTSLPVNFTGTLTYSTTGTSKKINATATGGADAEFKSFGGWRVGGVMGGMAFLAAVFAEL